MKPQYQLGWREKPEERLRHSASPPPSSKERTFSHGRKVWPGVSDPHSNLDSSVYYLFARGAVINCYKLGGKTTEIYFRTVLEARSPRSRCQQGWLVLRAERENPLHAAVRAPGGWRSLAFFDLQKHNPNFCLRLHKVLSLLESLYLNPPFL